MRTETLEVKREYCDNGQLESESYWLNGKLHNTEGPAYRTFYENGQVEYEEYWLNGKKLTEQEWQEQVKMGTSCDGKQVTIDGKTYILKEVK